MHFQIKENFYLDYLKFHQLMEVLVQLAFNTK
jgi:hypothetical protein